MPTYKEGLDLTDLLTKSLNQAARDMYEKTAAQVFNACWSDEVEKPKTIEDAINAEVSRILHD